MSMVNLEFISVPIGAVLKKGKKLTCSQNYQAKYQQISRKISGEYQAKAMRQHCIK